MNSQKKRAFHNFARVDDRASRYSQVAPSGGVDDNHSLI